MLKVWRGKVLAVFGVFLRKYYQFVRMIVKNRVNLIRMIFLKIFNPKVYGIETDLRDVITTIFSNLASEDPYTKGCSISKKYLIEYGFSHILVDHVFKEILETADINFDQFKDFIEEVLTVFDFGGSRFKDNEVKVKDNEVKVKDNEVKDKGKSRELHKYLNETFKIKKIERKVLDNPERIIIVSHYICIHDTCKWVKENTYR